MPDYSKLPVAILLDEKRGAEIRRERETKLIEELDKHIASRESQGGREDAPRASADG